ncbi:MAG: class I SAM-dependent methyltransferase [Candidatus Omnitrophica bacterium]|nr:class I SAM-dependent methyltransferase [Candidatus Omnitrophota bacterium]
MSEIDTVRDYWENHPLYSYEIKHELGSPSFFKDLDRLRIEDVERFCLSFWDFSDFSKGKSLLDIGCGPGFLTRHFAFKRYDVSAIDLSQAAVSLTRKSLELCGLDADVRQGNAEDLEFKDNSFDYVISSGVLHHTPDTRKAILEAYRVLKPGGKAKITLYYRNILLRKPFWGLTRFLAKNMLKNVPGRGLLAGAQDPEEFIRIYDGDVNPVGKGYTLGEAKRMLSPPFIWASSEVHFFPARFMPHWLPLNRPIHRFLDSCFGTLLYIDLVKTER